MQGFLLYLEARACRTTLMHYLLVCLNGRLGWIPYTDVLESPDAPKITKENPLDYDDITFNGCCLNFNLDFDFGD